MVKEESSYKQMDVVLNTGVAPLRLSIRFWYLCCHGWPSSCDGDSLPHYDMFFFYLDAVLPSWTVECLKK